VVCVPGTRPWKKCSAGGYFQKEHAPQMLQEVELLCAHDPAAQVWHVESEVAATTAEYVPAEQIVQTEAPSVEYAPAQHWVQNELPIPDE